MQAFRLKMRRAGAMRGIFRYTFNVMRLLTTFIIFGALAVSPAFANDELGSAVNTDDICEARPDICGATQKRTKKKRARATSSLKKKKKAEAQNINDEAFNDFFNDELEAAPPKPKKETMAAPTPTAATVTPASRQPSSFEPKAQRHRVSFSDYMNANANHPVLSVRRSQFQDAFPNVNRPATFTATTAPAEGGAAKEGATPPVSAPAATSTPPPSSSSDMATGN